MPNRTLTAIDVFAGGGGTSQALILENVQLLAALNHDPVAMRTHALNHPNTLHFQQDAETFDLGRLPACDIMTFSPECRRHSPASAGVVKREQTNKQLGLWTDDLPDTFKSRNTMSQVVRFARAVRPRIVIVENIVQVTQWNGWLGWLDSMRALGYSGQVHCLNAAHFGAPQSRNRLYAIFWKHPTQPTLSLTPAAHCALCDTTVSTIQRWRTGRAYGAWGRQYDYVCPNCANVLHPPMTAASTVIDLTLPAPTLGERAARGRPLVARTLERIQRGLDHPRCAAGPFLASYYSGSDQFTPLRQPMPTITTHDRHLLIIPSTDRRLENCCARLLTVTELQQAMGFQKNHRFAGTHAQIVRQIGNAVVVSMMQALLSTVLPALA